MLTSYYTPKYISHFFLGIRLDPFPQALQSLTALYLMKCGKKKKKTCNIMTLENLQQLVLCGPPLGLAGRLTLNVTNSWQHKLVSLGPRE